MPIRKFSIQWPEELGPLWINRDNLLNCLAQRYPRTLFIVKDITNDTLAIDNPKTALLQSSDQDYLTQLEFLNIRKMVSNSS